MTPPFTPPNHKLAVVILVCTSVLGGALLLSHARHNPLSTTPHIPSTEQRDDLPPVW
jgi:hypothetical protein